MHLILAGHGTAIVEIGNERGRNAKMMACTGRTSTTRFSLARNPTRTKNSCPSRPPARLKWDSRLLVSVASLAQKAADSIQGKAPHQLVET